MHADSSPCPVYRIGFASLLLNGCYSENAWVHESYNIMVASIHGACSYTIYSGTPLYIAATLGEQHFGRYIGVAFIAHAWGVVLYTNCSFGTWVPGRYNLSQLIFNQWWPLRGVSLYMQFKCMLLLTFALRYACMVNKKSPIAPDKVQLQLDDVQLLGPTWCAIILALLNTVQIPVQRYNNHTIIHDTVYLWLCAL